MSLATFLRPVLTIAGVAALSLTASCGVPIPGMHHPHGPTALVERDSSNGKTVHVRPGERVTLILSSSYWTINGSSAPAIVRQDGPVTVLPPPPGGCVPGGGCRPVRAYFTVRKPGRAVITAHRRSCGEAMQCGPSQRYFRLVLLVG